MPNAPGVGSQSRQTFLTRIVPGDLVRVEGSRKRPWRWRWQFLLCRLRLCFGPRCMDRFSLGPRRRNLERTNAWDCRRIWKPTAVNGAPLCRGLDCCFRGSFFQHSRHASNRGTISKQECRTSCNHGSESELLVRKNMCHWGGRRRHKVAGRSAGNVFC